MNDPNVYENTQEQWADDVLEYVGVEPEIYQVMGGYALSKVPGMMFDSKDCDFFVRAGSLGEFKRRVMDKIGKISAYFLAKYSKSSRIGTYPEFWFDMEKHGGWLVDMKVYLKQYSRAGIRTLKGFHFQFVYMSDNYSHIQIANFFDISCCRVRLFHNNGKLVLVSNNAFVKESIAKREMEVRRSAINAHRISKYIERGFEVTTSTEDEFFQTPTTQYRVSLNGPEGYEYLKSCRAYRVNWYVLKFCVRLLVLSRRTRERMYAPGGCGFEVAAKSFKEHAANKRIKLNQ